MDERPKLADAFRRLQAGDGPLWITWGERRLLLGAVTDEWLARGEGTVIVATRRGYRIVTLVGRHRENMFTPARLRVGFQSGAIVADKRVRALVLEDHAR